MPKELRWRRPDHIDPDLLVKRVMDKRWQRGPWGRRPPGRPWRTTPPTARERLRSEQNRKRPHIRVTLPRVNFLKRADA
jgi:hypothetical protein